MNDADSPGNGQSQGAAPGQEPLIPKHRFDEIQARLKEAQDREALKDQLYAQQMAQYRQPQKQEPVLTPEDTGLDPSTHQAVLRVSQTLLNQALQKQAQQFQGVIGQMGNELEQAKFLAVHGRDKGKYLPLIQEYQRRHQQTTGQWIDAENAYKLVRFDEMEANERRGSMGQAAPAPAFVASPAPAAAPAGQAPARQAPAPSASSGSHFSEMSIEEQEAALEEQFGSGNLL